MSRKHNPRFYKLTFFIFNTVPFARQGLNLSFFWDHGVIVLVGHAATTSSGLLDASRKNERAKFLDSLRLYFIGRLRREML